MVRFVQILSFLSGYKIQFILNMLRDIKNIDLIDFVLTTSYHTRRVIRSEKSLDLIDLKGLVSRLTVKLTDIGDSSVAFMS